MRRSARRREAGGATGLSLLPFLDVVFSTIGIFLLIFAVQVMARTPEARRPVPAAIVTCIDGETLVYHATPGADPEPFQRWQASDLVARIAEGAVGVANVLLAVGAECAAPQRSFVDAFQEAAARLAADPDGARPLLRLQQAPLSSASDAVDAVLARWGGRD